MLFRIPELRALADTDRAQRITHLAIAQVERRRTVVATIVGILLSVVLVYVVFAVRRHYGLEGELFDIPTIVVTSIVYAHSMWWFRRREIRRSVRRILRNTTDLCAGCGYCVVGVMSGRCPECGEPMGPSKGALLDMKR